VTVTFPAGPALLISRIERPEGSLVRLDGMIDESCEEEALVAGLGRVVVFDLDAVRRITSAGMRRWMDALRRLRAESYYFIRCRPAIVWQFNTVEGFGGAGTLVDLYAPSAASRCRSSSTSATSTPTWSPACCPK
jgi:hypothetical protein